MALRRAVGDIDQEQEMYDGCLVYDEAGRKMRSVRL